MLSSQNQPQQNYLEMLSLSIGITLGSAAALMFLLVIVVTGMQLEPGLAARSLSPGLPAGWQRALAGQAQAMGLPLTAETPAFWYMSRASALLAYLLMWGSTVWGLMLSTRIVKSLVPPPLTFSVHEFLSLAGLGFAAFHALILLGDHYIPFGLFDILVPFTAPYKPFWVGVGTLNLYLSALLTGSFYVKKRIGQKAWRALHYLTFLAFVMTLGHGLSAGADSGVGLLRLAYLGSAGSVLFLIYYRIIAR